MKAMIGMSGGVDSSVAALLMQREGYSCIGATMLLCPREDSLLCGSSRDAEDARAVAHRLGMEHRLFDLREDFSRLVIDKFVRTYEEGGTPNPCIDCNRLLKFGLLMELSGQLGCDCVVSGHYAVIEYDPGAGRYLLKRASDHSKDQTYFLASLTQEQLSRIRFPLGGLTKDAVRAIAEENGFLNARKRDSQDICFVPDGDYAAFLTRYTGRELQPGDYRSLDGTVVGRHRGTECYTIGQRRGLGLAMGAPVYVVGKDPKTNTVTVGPDEALYSRGLIAGDWCWHPFPALTRPLRVTAKIRHSQYDRPATVFPEADGRARVIFDEPQRAISPGQAVALYDGDCVIGGGTILKALKEG